MLNMRTLSQRSVRAVAPRKVAAGRRSTVSVQAKRNEVSVSYAKALVELADEKSKLEPVHAGEYQPRSGSLCSKPLSSLNRLHCVNFQYKFDIPCSEPKIETHICGWETTGWRASTSHLYIAVS